MPSILYNEKEDLRLHPFLIFSVIFSAHSLFKANSSRDRIHLVKFQLEFTLKIEHLFIAAQFSAKNREKVGSLPFLQPDKIVYQTRGTEHLPFSKKSYPDFYPDNSFCTCFVKTVVFRLYTAKPEVQLTVPLFIFLRTSLPSSQDSRCRLFSLRREAFSTASWFRRWQAR